MLLNCFILIYTKPMHHMHNDVPQCTMLVMPPISYPYPRVNPA